MNAVDFEAQDDEVMSQLRYSTWYSAEELCNRTGMKHYEVRDSLTSLFLQGKTVERCVPGLVQTRVYAKYFPEGKL